MDTRNYNVGKSDYCKHKYQPWDFWIKFKMNPFDGDILKRVLRTKETDPRIMDYQKIRHICLERIRQYQENINVWDISSLEYNPVELKEMTKDYTSLVPEDMDILVSLVYPSDNRLNDYMKIIDICDKRIGQLNGQK